MGLKGMLKSTDMLGPPISLTFNGSDTMKTMTGSILTICLMVATVAAICYFLIQFFDRSNPTVTERVIRSKNLLPNKFGESKMLPIYLIRDTEGTLLDVDIAVKTINATIEVAYGKFIDGKYTKGTYNYNQTACKDIIKDASLLDYFTDAQNYPEIKSDILNYGVCLKVPAKDASLLLNDNPNRAISSKENQVYSNTQFLISPCNYNTYADCQTKTKLIKQQRSIDLVFPTYILEFQNDKQPLSKYFDLENAETITDFKNFNIKKYLPTESSVENESQYFGESEIVNSFISLEPFNSETVPRKQDPADPNLPLVECGLVDSACTMFISITFQPNRIEKRYNRQYHQILDLLSDIGGIFSLLMQVFGFVNGVIIGLLKNNIFISRLLPMLPIKALTCRKKKKYPEVVHDEDRNIDEQHTFWDGLRDDAAEMVESSIDLSVLFKEICAIRVIANLLLDDKQKEMVTLASFYEFRINKSKIDEDSPDTDVGPGKKPPSSIIRERRKRAKALAEIIQRYNSPQQPSQNNERFSAELSRKIDEKIIQAYQRLKLDSIKIDHQAMKDIAPTDGFDRPASINPTLPGLMYRDSAPPNLEGHPQTRIQNDHSTPQQPDAPASFNVENDPLIHARASNYLDDIEESKP